MAVFRTFISACLCLVLTLGMTACANASSSVNPEPVLVMPNRQAPDHRELRALAYETQMARDKGLIVEDREVIGAYRFDDHYCQRYAYYRNLLTAYLLSTLPLVEADRAVAADGGASGLSLGKVQESYLYGTTSPLLALYCLYVKNEIHIERLSQEDVAVLERLFQQGYGQITQEALDFVKRTYPELIREYSEFTEAPYASGDWPIGEDGTRLNPDALVVGIYIAKPEIVKDSSSTSILFGMSNTTSNNVTANMAREQAYNQFSDKQLPRLYRQLSGKLEVPLVLENRHFRFDGTSHPI
jgi:hypothetical protein